MPNVTERPDDPNLDSTPPYTLVWPGEGNTNEGPDPQCDTTPPFRKGRRARSNFISVVKGISKRGEFWKEGSYTSSDGANHLSFFFHQNQCYNGGAEYGFTRKLNEGNATLYFYQCAACNTGSRQYTKKSVWSYAGSDRTYRVILQTDGDFEIKVFKVNSDGSLTLVHSEVVTKASWMPNLYGAGGYITANVHTGDPATTDSYGGSFNQVDKVKYLP